MEAEAREALVAAIKSLPGVTGVSTKPIGNGRKANDHGIVWNIYSQRCRSACTNADGARPTLDDCIQDCIERLRVSLGANVVDAAIAAVANPAAEHSAADLEWLVGWCEAHEAPETITLQMAEEALLEHRRREGGRSAGAVLQEAQLLAAQQRAAERAVQAAQQRLDRAKEALEHIRARQSSQARSRLAPTGRHRRVRRAGRQTTRASSGSATTSASAPSSCCATTIGRPMIRRGSRLCCGRGSVARGLSSTRVSCAQCRDDRSATSS